MNNGPHFTPDGKLTVTGRAHLEAELAKAAAEELKENCPTCGAPVKTIFDHLDLNCEVQ